MTKYRWRMALEYGDKAQIHTPVGVFLVEVTGSDLCEGKLLCVPQYVVNAEEK